MSVSPRFVRALVAPLLLAVAGAASAGSADAGRTLYESNCSACHGTLGAPLPWSATSIRAAINGNQGGMAMLSWLSDAQLADIASYLADPLTNDSDRLFNWAERQYSPLLSPSAQSQDIGGFYARYYRMSNLYLATHNGRLYVYDANQPANGVQDVGRVVDWLSRAGL